MHPPMQTSRLVWLTKRCLNGIFRCEVTSNEIEFTVNLNHNKEILIFVGAIVGVAIVSAAVPIVVVLIKKRRMVKKSGSVEGK
jgi:hypothetical protein